MNSKAASAASKYFEKGPLLDLRESQVIIEPTGSGPGYWVGACGAVHDEESGMWYLSYRVREPRPVRGGRCRIASSPDGISFSTIWECSKEDYGSESIEKSSLLKGPDGLWWLYTSYVDPKDQRWKIDLLRARSPDAFDTSTREEVLTAAQIGCEGVKDPFAFHMDGKIYLLVSYATGITGADKADMHGTGDIYNTGLTRSSSGLAVSDDGINFQWLGDVFAPSEDGWDCYASRLNSFIYRKPFFLGFYDGSASVKENYEERTGLAVSIDLKTWHRLTPYGPHVVSRHQTGSLRYCYPVDHGDHVKLYYEFCRADGAHEIRMNQLAI